MNEERFKETFRAQCNVKETNERPLEASSHSLPNDITSKEAKDRIINYDWLGWPVYKMNLRQILYNLGAVLNKETNKLEIENNEFLDVFPRILHDDGMGYGVNEEFITEACSDIEYSSCIIWAESRLKNIDMFIENGLQPYAIFKNENDDYIIDDIIKDEDSGEIKVRCHKFGFYDSPDNDKVFDIETVKNALQMTNV